MHGSFTSNTYNITALLGRASFPNYTAKRVTVPPFQRSYSWEQSHVSRFWQDILTFHNQLGRKDSQDAYFLGPIVILPGKDSITLLDGQQRLATATILLAVIRDIARAKGGQPGSDLARDIHRDLILVDEDEGIFAITMNELDDPYFRTNIQEDPPSSTEKARLRSHRLIRQASSFLFSEVEKLVNGLNLKELIVKLKALRKTVDAHLKIVAIEVLSEDDAFLIFETLNDRGLRLAVPDLVLNYLMRTAKSDSERKRVRESWNSIVENLGQRNISVFLRHMWVSRYGDVKSQGLFAEIRDNLTAYNVESLEFAELCAAESEKYISIINLNKEVLGEDALPYVEGLIKYLDADRALPLLLSGLVCLAQGDFAKLTRATATVVTRHSVFAGLNPSNLEDTLYSAARVLRAKRLDGGDSKTCLKEAKDVLRKINPTRDQVRSKLQDVYLTRNQARYIVYALAEKMQSRTKAIKLSTNSLEHIFPQNAQSDEWPNVDELEPYLWHMGNLTVIEPSNNRDLGRKSYELKKKVYPKSEIVMTQVVPQRNDSWEIVNIINRATGFLPLINEVWPEEI